MFKHDRMAEALAKAHPERWRYDPPPFNAGAIFGVFDGEPINTARMRPTIKNIIRVVCEYYGISHVDLISQRRTRDLARPRQVAMYLAKTHTESSYPTIGKSFGSRDHTTVMHGFRTIEARIKTDGQLADDVATLSQKFQRAR